MFAHCEFLVEVGLLKDEQAFRQFGYVVDCVYLCQQRWMNSIA